MQITIGLALGLAVALLLWPRLRDAVMRRIVERELLRMPLWLPVQLYGADDLCTILGDAVPMLGGTPPRASGQAWRDALLRRHGVALAALQRSELAVEDVADWLEQTGILAEVGTDVTTAARELAALDPRSRRLRAASGFTEYRGVEPIEAGLRLAAEFGPLGAVLTAWPLAYSHRWRAHASLVAAIADRARVFVAVPGAAWHRAVAWFLERRGVGPERVFFLEGPVDDVWMRDFGPSCLVDTDARRAAIAVNPYAPRADAYLKGNNEMALVFARTAGLPAYRLPLLVEGGNLVTDGRGLLLMSDSVLARNPELERSSLDTIVDRQLGCSRLVLIPQLPGEVTGHLDMVVRFLDEQTVVVAEAPSRFRWSRCFDAIAAQLAATRSSLGDPLRILRLPVVSTRSSRPEFWSTVNHIAVNGRIVMPFFDRETDQRAQSVLRAAGFEDIVSIDFRDFPVGSVHCQTKEVPVLVTAAMDLD